MCIRDRAAETERIVTINDGMIVSDSRKMENRSNICLLYTSNACPPMVVGVGIGGTFEKCALLAKQALTRPVNEHSDIPYVKDCLLYTSRCV